VILLPVFGVDVITALANRTYTSPVGKPSTADKEVTFCQYL
jgi:hypothetical protein